MATPQIIERRPGLTTLVIRNRPGVSAYQFGAANTVDAAFAGATTMFTVPHKGSYRSPTLQRTALGRTDGSYRGLTLVQFTFDDFASATIHGDNAINFVRVTELDLAGNPKAAGPIFVVPAPEFFSTAHRTLNLSGTAPDVASLATGLPPTGAMVISFPRMTDNLVLINDDTVGSNSLYVSLGAGQPEMEIPSGDSFEFAFGGTDIHLHGDGATVPFRLAATVVSGLR